MMISGPRPLRVILTRPDGQLEPLASRVWALGCEVVPCPLIRIEPLSDEPIETGGYDWIVVTSVNGAHELARRRSGTLQKVAAIGPGTAAALAGHGIAVDLVPAISTQEGLVSALPDPPGRVLFAAAERARDHLPQVLGADVIVLYRTVDIVPEVAPEGDVVLLASASAARAFAALGVSVPAVSIGPQTTRAARAAGLEVLAEAVRHDLEGLVAALASVPWSSAS